MPEATSQLSSVWINILSLLKEPMAPTLHPATLKPLTTADLTPIFPMSLIEQEFSPKPEIDIPGGILDIYRLWRPTPLFRARRLEQELDTPEPSSQPANGGFLPGHLALT